jgi:hypothetical protein
MQSKSDNSTPQYVHLTNYVVYITAVVTVVLITSAAPIFDNPFFSTRKMQSLFVAVNLIWLGYVLGISFLEAWKKFQAVSLNRKVGLDVGRTVFHALNRVEIILNAILVVLFIKSQGLQQLFPYWQLGSLSLILLLQVIWLQPSLDNRALIIIKGDNPPANMVHFIYIFGELAKVVTHVLVFKTFFDSL